jgi:cytochrome b involved in lipid metabolism
MSKTFSKDAVASHNKGDSLWIVIDEDVYDVTKFQDEHPGKFFLLIRALLESRNCHATSLARGAP